MAAKNVLRRAMLYVPGSSQRFLDKSRSLNVDCIAYDLEDSVTPNRKAEARSLVRKALDLDTPGGVKERAVRINSVGSGLALADLQELAKSQNLTTLVVPKVESASDLTFISDVLAHTRSTQMQPHSHNGSETKGGTQIGVLALIESARSLSNLQEICRATPHMLQGLVFAAEDFALDMSITRTPSLMEFLYARQMIATAARAHNLPSTLDLVTTAFKSEADQETLVNECEQGKGMGYNGKQCIHPSQVQTVQRIFSPSPQEVEWAVRITIAQKRAEEQGKGAWAMDGKMIDAPVEGKARAVVAKAELCGFEVAELREKYKDQQPE
ncbi:citrate lyase subunit beta-like protein [Capronia coronata CBS 617.96]|uniref:Citrate lyase subunit beta-like protein n=1 Tax=Capronia coronata CBS 617.96 TaxID=1182541 RepID=W9YBW1_9EURO|nr:citrate lyase subunit beta-like protein [Capronia coronata CBS 617.96]EXJ90327.1 citrate lyase subunit beta-like protein [Capronia coronata CBS 617.96]